MEIIFPRPIARKCNSISMDEDSPCIFPRFFVSLDSKWAKQRLLFIRHSELVTRCFLRRRRSKTSIDASSPFIDPREKGQSFIGRITSAIRLVRDIPAQSVLTVLNKPVACISPLKIRPQRAREDEEGPFLTCWSASLSIMLFGTMDPRLDVFFATFPFPRSYRSREL